MGLWHKASDEFANSVKESDDLTYQLGTKAAYHALDAGIMVGAGYRLMSGQGMNPGIRCCYGLVDTTIDDSARNQYNRAAYLTVGIPIGAGQTTDGGNKWQQSAQ
jgi:hypothetical protein